MRRMQLKATRRESTALAVALTSLCIVGCDQADPAQEFFKARSVPIELAYARERDESSTEPLRALMPVDEGKEPGQLAKLGNKLYHDTILSGDNTVSCASCHEIAKGGDDGLPVSIGMKGAKGPINAPTVLNSRFNFRQFWDGRALDLFEQAQGPVANPKEMGADWDRVVERVGEAADYAALFKSAFGDPNVSRERIARAIAAFERELITPSPFDAYLLGSNDAISDQARHGYGLFKSYGCVACHQGINVGGNLYQKFGALQSVEELTTEADRGLEGRTNREEDKSVFKVPSLRNVALTAPYFHNSSVNDLPSAVRVMGAVQLGITLPERDVASIVEFLNSLTGETPNLARFEYKGDRS